MDDHNDFDSVSWRREGEPELSRPTSDEISRTTLPTRISSGKQPARSTHQEAQAGELAEPVDLAGIGDGILECTVGSPVKENDGTKDAFVSYLIQTTVSARNGYYQVYQRLDRFQIFPRTRVLYSPAFYRLCLPEKYPV